RADRRPDPGDPDREREVLMSLLLLAERESRELLGPAEALPAVRDAFVRLTRGEAILPGVIHLDVPNSGAEVHVKGAHLRGSRFFTIKVASGSYANPERGLPVGSGIVLVFDSTTGFPRAVLFDNGYLTDLRTGAAGALAADLLANREVHRIGIVGVGTQARYQLAALLGVRTPERVIAFGRSEAKATAFAQEMEKLHRIRVLPAADVYAELGEIAAGLKRGRTSEQEITVADLTGVGVQDAAVAELVVTVAPRRGVGKALDI